MISLRAFCSCKVNKEGVGSLWFYPDGSQLASATCEWDDEEDDLVGVLKVWIPESNTVATRQDRNYSGNVALAPNGGILAWAGAHGRLQLIDVFTGKAIATLQLSKNRNIDCLRFSPAGDLLFAAEGRTVEEETGQVAAWDTSSWRVLYTLPTGWVMSLSVSPNGGTLATGMVTGDLQLWDLRSRRRLASLPAHHAQVVSAAIHPSGRLLATAGMSEALRLWDISENRFVPHPLPKQAPIKGINVVAFLPSGEMLTGDEAGHVTIWDSQTGMVLAQYSTNEAFLDFQLMDEGEQITLQSVAAPEVTSLAVSADGNRVAAGNIKGGVQIWAVER